MLSEVLKVSVLSIIYIVIFYLLLSLILKYTWNSSITEMLNSPPINLMEALFLIITTNILFGTFQHGAFLLYTGATGSLMSRNF
jgi:hypothetical protein